MKKLKMIYCWILISVMFQVVVLSYINFIYLPGRGTIKATMYEADTAAVKSHSLKLPDGAAGVTVSFDGFYAAYRIGKNLVIADMDTRKTIKTLDPAGGEFTCFKWLPDREMLIYSIKEPEGKSGQVRISTFDIGPELDRSYPVIKSLPANSEVMQIVLSPLTNIVYPMIKVGKTSAKIYKFDIMDNIKFIMSTSTSTDIFETMYSDSLVYQSPEGGIRIRSGKSGGTSRLPVKGATRLLATDDNDFIYAAASDKNGSITAIYSGKAGQKAAEWETLSLDKPVEAENIFVTAAGVIYYTDVGTKTIHALEGTGVTEYQGDLLTVLDDYAVTVDGNKLLLKILKK
jgi:hypothetical protein